jgi:hypothetical protein
VSNCIISKSVPLLPCWRQGGEGCTYYLFLNSALDGGEWSMSRPGRALPPRKGPRVLIVQEAGWAPEPVWTQRIEEKSFAFAGYRTQIVRSDTISQAHSPRERTPGTHWIGGWVGPRAGLDTEARGHILSPMPGIERRSPGRPARSQTPY